MFAYKLHQILFLFVVNGCYCQRRIKDGEAVTNEKKYVVYLLKAAISPRYYDGWLCGGALVSPEFIVTSAACVTDVTHLYAIAGYNKYVKDTDINTDPCTKAKKKKVILTCTPKAYELKYEEIEKWSYIDIAVVKVESPYDFEDTTYSTICSYTPVPIIINYEMKYQEAGIDAIVFGWGHKAKWREQADPSDYNEEMLMYAPTLIQNKEDCKKEYAVYNGMDEIIDKYMICTFNKGNINDAGETILKSEPTAQGCNVQQRKLRGMESVSCENANSPGQEIVLIENTRKDNKPSNFTIKSFNQTYSNNLNNITNVDPKLRKDVNQNVTKNVDQKLNYLSNDIYRNVVDTNLTQNYSLNEHRRFGSLRTRRHGICQNDHGGPLVTWVGSHEVLIGVASVFKITEDLECIGPYLFTSTQCNGAFLDCILRSDDSKTEAERRAICDSEYGFKLVETHISWKDHPDGPAENEKHSADSNLTIHATIDLKFEKQKPNDLHAHTNISALYHNFTSTHLVFNKTGPINNEIPTRTTTDKKIADFTSTTPSALKKDNSTILTNVSFTILTNVTSINILNVTSLESNKNASRLELKSAASVNLSNATSLDLAIANVSSNVLNVTSTDFTKPTTKILTSSSQNLNLSISTSPILLGNVVNGTASTQESILTAILISTVSANLVNVTTSKPTSGIVAS